MKKAVATIAIILLSVSSISLTANASGNKIVPSAVVDTEKVPHKEFQPQLLDNQQNTLRAAAVGPHWVADSSCDEGYFSDNVLSYSASYTDSTKSTRKQIDRIYARLTVYNEKAFAASGTDDQSNSSYAGATASVHFNPWEDGESYGTHKFEHAGYQSWYPETYGD